MRFLRYSCIKSSSTFAPFSVEMPRYISKHDGFVHFNERVFITDVRIQKHIKLLTYQQIDNSEVYIRTKDALLYSCFEEGHGFHRIAVLPILHHLIYFGIFLNVFKKAFVRLMKHLNAFLKDCKYHFQHIVRLFKDFCKYLSLSACAFSMHSFNNDSLSEKTS